MFPSRVPLTADIVQAGVDAFDNRDCDCSKFQLSPMFRDFLSGMTPKTIPETALFSKAR